MKGYTSALDAPIRTGRVLMGAAFLLVASSSWAQAPGAPNGYGYGPNMMWGGAWYAMFLGPLFIVLLLVAVFAAVALLSRWFGAPWHGQASPHHPPLGRSPLDILKERYARGEIDKEEYEERRRVLGE